MNDERCQSCGTPMAAGISLYDFDCTVPIAELGEELERVQAGRDRYRAALARIAEGDVPDSPLKVAGLAGIVTRADIVAFVRSVLEDTSE